ncbi:MAG: flavodoxin family protein [Clostridia bacterium]|nr:flavodoxin family protein [Clostridia bacterium]
MKVLMLNGSSKKDGNTYLSLLEIGKQLEKEGIEYEIFQIGGAPLRDCIGCGQCSEKGCIFGDDDGVNEFIEKAKEADGFVFGTPVYYAHPSGRIQSFLDRVFYSSSAAFRFKVGASVAVARRGGTTASFDVLNKYFGISQMSVAGSTYWNIAHGAGPGEVDGDKEGLQTMRNLARNMAWMLKCFEAGKKAGIELPKTETGNRTNFIR